MWNKWLTYFGAIRGLAVGVLVLIAFTIYWIVEHPESYMTALGLGGLLIFTIVLLMVLKRKLAEFNGEV